MRFSMLTTVFVLSLGGAVLAGDGAPNPARSPAQPEAKKKSELEWARGVADDFLAACIGGDNAEAEMLLTTELKKRYERYPNTIPLATRLLDVSYAGLTTARISHEQMAPGEDECRITGKLTGKRNGKPIESDFALRVVKDEGKWRVSYFRQKWRWVEGHPSTSN